MKATYTPSLFTPSEAEVITGVSVTLQRDWRHRGFLEKGEGHARFDVFALARLVIMKALADRGIGPSETSEISKVAAAGVVSWLGRYWDTWDGDFDLALSWAKLSPSQSKEEKIEAILEYANLGTSQKLRQAWEAMPDDLIPSHWRSRNLWMTQQFMLQFGFPLRPSRFFLWWSNGLTTFEDSLDEALGVVTRHDDEVQSAIVILDFDGIAAAIDKRSIRPFVYVEFPRNELGDVVAPLEYGAPVPFTQTPQ